MISGLPGFFYFPLRFGLEQVQLIGSSNAGLFHPLAHAHQTVVFFFPMQAFCTFVALVRTGGGMAHGLGQFLHVKKNGGVLVAAKCNALLVHLAKTGIVPALGLENVQARAVFLVFGKAFKSFGYAAFDGLVLGRYRNSIAIVPHRYGHGDLQYPGGIHGFKKMPFGGAAVAYGDEDYLVALLAELLSSRQTGLLPV